MIRKKFIAANLKMHFDVAEASTYLHNLSKTLTSHREIEVVIAPSLVAIQPLSREIDVRKIKLAAQNAYFEDEGAYTGEVSFSMLKGIASYIIIGHSERRIYFHEENDVIAKKVKAALRNRMGPILCVGENITERRDGHAKRVINDQITSALSHLTEEEMHNIVIAYEPVWAISTFGNEQAMPDDVEKMINEIRKQITYLYGEKVAESVRVIYGGSVKADNVASYLAIPGCDGALVGGASLNYLEFNKIVQSCFNVMQS